MPQITLIPGDGNGVGVARQTRRVLAAAGLRIDWDEVPLEADKIPARVLESLTRTRLGLMGFQHAWKARHAAPPITKIRDAFQLFANVRPIRTLPGLPTRHGAIDLVLVREVTEDVYRHLEHESIPGVYESLKVTTKAACERIATHAFEYARAHGRKKVTIVHKANIMKKSDGMFVKTARAVAEKYPEVQCEDVIVDALCMKLVLTPERFDVLVAGNLYGDIVADLCAGLVGGASNCPSINVGSDVRVFAGPHGTPGGGEDDGNPLELLLPAVELVRHLGDAAAADRIRAAASATLLDGVLPLALGGDNGCEAFADAVVAHLETR